MNNPNPKRPFALYVLMFLLLLLGISAIYGDYNLIVDPSGAQLQMPIGWIENTPFKTYLIPGWILFTVLGMLPLITVFALWLRPAWSWLKGLESLTHQHWSWLASVAVGITLIIWITVQFLMFGARHPVQIGLEITLGIVGILIIAVSFIPSVRRYYTVP